ncbi:MAG: M23 family metallopeptidase [Bacteroidetes bacterium]|nr:M23 family metallopeptidase [Bacteroidota bacterium]
MSKVKYKFDTKSLTYERVKITLGQRLWRITSYLAMGLVFATISIVLAGEYLPSPTEKKKAREIEALQLQYGLLDKKMKQAELVLKDLADRDDNIYRVILESDPLPKSVRYGGSGGSDKYAIFDTYDNGELIKSATERMDRISKQMYVQAKSFDDVVSLAKNKKEMLASIPAIMPLNNKDLKHMPSGWGWRTHPIYKTSEFHPGMDFAAPLGTELYATGDGIVELAANTSNGYGIHVILDHSYGYRTLYGHMSKTAVKTGQKVKRGQLIGYVGSTGLSTGPHVHYEVFKNGERTNPINFYYNDLTPEQYQQLLELSRQATQAFD